MPWGDGLGTGDVGRRGDALRRSFRVHAILGGREHVQAHGALHGSHHMRHGAVAPCPAAAFAGPASPIKRTILQRADVPGTNLEIIYATVEIAAGFKAGRHNHPGVVMGQVVEGDFWLHVDGQPEQILHAGESVTLPDRAMHNEGAMDKPVKLHAVYVVEKGAPSSRQRHRGSPAPTK